MNFCEANGDVLYQKCNSSFTLSTQERECIETFLLHVGTSSTVTDNECRAFKFLAARKFNVQEAVELFYSYEAFLRSEGINTVNPFDESVRSELLSGKFTVLNDNDLSGARVAQFFVRLHRPTRSTHKAFLQSVVFQLNAALRKETAIRNGIILIYDMTNAKYSNFDADLSKKLFNMLKSCYPIRLRRIIVLTAPFWFRASFHLLRVFIKEELRDRVHVLRPLPGSRLASLSNPDPAVAQKAHYAWLLTALSETVAIPDELFSTPGLGTRQPSAAISAFFHASNNGGGSGSTNSTIDCSGRSSPSASDAGDEAAMVGPLTEDEGLMAEIGCCSPNWDPFALSSSQSSDAESTGLPVNPATGCAGADTDGIAAARNNVMSMSCSPVLSAIPITSSINGEIRNIKPQAAKMGQEPFRDPAGTPTPPAIPKFGNPLNGARVDGDFAATPTSETAPSTTACTGAKHLHSCTSRSNRTPSGGQWVAQQAPLASQDDFTVSGLEDSTSTDSSNTIRNEKRLKQTTAPLSTPSFATGLATVRPSDLIPSWALNRPTGPSIQVGPHRVTGGLQQPNNDPQPDKFYCIGEASSATHSSLTSPRLCSRVLQSPPTQVESDPTKAQIDRFFEDSDSDIDKGDSNGQITNEAPGDDEVDKGDYDDDDEEEEAADLDLDGLWMTIDQLASHVAELGLGGLVEEYSAMCSIKTDDPCTAFRHPWNSSKNRYVDVACLEHSRVRLRSHLHTAGHSTSPIPTTTAATASDGKAAKVEKQVPIYIHANWVDSYRQRNAFICTQGKLHVFSSPLQETAGDFWCMIWNYNVPAIVMITRCYESQRCKCFQYWPPVEGQSLRFTTISSSSSTLVVPGTSWGGGNSSGTVASSKRKPHSGRPRRSASEVSNFSKFVFEVVHVASHPGSDYTRTKLRLKEVKSGQSRIVNHYAFHSWPDHGVPSDSSALLELLATVQIEYAATINRELGYTNAYDTPIPPPPIVVHCSAGIGRTGTFIALDVSTKQLMELGVVNIPLTVARIRSQRSGCVQVSTQYLFVYRALIDFALTHGLVAAGIAEAAVHLLTTPARTPMPSLLPFSSVSSLPMDASLLSVLATGVGSSDATDPVLFSTLMRCLHNQMTTGEVENSSNHRLSTELDYETEEMHEATEEAESDDEPRPAEILSKEEMDEKEPAAIGPEVDVVSSVVKAAAGRPSGEEMASAAAAAPVVVGLGESPGF
ncbi:Tyrosine-protein phosphatase non-receptor type 9 [Echinococcus granulosus]|nr:Tyrosine-protein phosphatase non-receptor type 9 [Echinococcus granulosus]